MHDRRRTRFFIFGWLLCYSSYKKIQPRILDRGGPIDGKMSSHLADRHLLVFLAVSTSSTLTGYKIHSIKDKNKSRPRESWYLLDTCGEHLDAANPSKRRGCHRRTDLGSVPSLHRAGVYRGLATSLAAAGPFISFSFMPPPAARSSPSPSPRRSPKSKSHAHPARGWSWRPHIYRGRG
jgi:hypothetical protein